MANDCNQSLHRAAAKSIKRCKEEENGKEVNSKVIHIKDHLTVHFIAGKVSSSLFSLPLRLLADQVAVPRRGGQEQRCRRRKMKVLL